MGEVLDNFEYGLNAQAIEFDGKNKYIRITDIDEESRKFLKNELTSPNTDLSLSEKYKLETGDILFARTGASVGKTYIYSEDDGIMYFAGFLIRAKIKQNFDINFIFINTLTKQFNDFIKITSQRSGQPGINAKEYADYTFLCPSISEQTAIGNFFKQLDETIALHQREAEKYKNLKNSYLEKMFPTENEQFPKLRFTNFTDAWEQRKLGELVDIVGGGTPDTTNKEFWNGDIDWYSPTEIGETIYAERSEKTITNLGLEKSSAKLLPANQTILFTSRASIGDMAILKNQGATNQGFQSFIIGEKLDVYFLYSMGYKIKEFALKNASGSTFLEISKNQLAKCIISLPNLEEQTAIGNFFKQLDETIALHQRKIEKYQFIKQLYLEQMFIK